MDAHEATLSIKSSFDYATIVRLTTDVFRSSDFGGTRIVDLATRNSPGRAFFRIAASGPILEAWHAKSGATVVKLSSETIDKAYGDYSDSLVKGLFMLARLKKLDKACAILPRALETVRAAVIRADPRAVTEISGRIADFV